MAEGQSIKLHIAGKEYALKAQTAESEHLMRFAADSINELLSKYDEKFPDKSLEDKLAFVALNQTVGRLTAQKKNKLATEEVEKLDAELVSYLENIENNR